MTSLDSISKSRDITCQQRSVSSKLWFLDVAMYYIHTVVRYGCESWTIKKAEH